MNTSRQSELAKIWSLIGKERTALLVTFDESGMLDARPMGCLQSDFDGTLRFLTFRHSAKLREIDQSLRRFVTSQSAALPASSRIGPGSASCGARACGCGFRTAAMITNSRSWR